MESDIVGYVSIAVVLGIGITSNYLIKKTFEFDKEQHHEQIQSSEAMSWEQIISNEDQHREQHQVQGLLEAFRILDSREHRESRRKVYQLYHEYRENNNEQVEIFKGPEIEDVRADFDIMGKLVRTNNIHKEDFLDEYGALAYRCWNCLKDHVEHERTSRNFKPFMTHFEWLSNEAYNYWKAKGYDLAKTSLYNPSEPDKKVDFQ
jgi:ribosomal protein S13